MRSGRVFFAALAFLIMIHPPAAGQSAYDSITEFLDAAAEWIEIDFRERGALSEDGSSTISAYFEGSDFYAIGAACDTDCSGISLTVDGDDYYVEIDGDRIATMTTWIPNAGTYSVTVTIYECSTSTCYWGAIGGIDWFMF